MNPTYVPQEPADPSSNVKRARAAGTVMGAFVSSFGDFSFSLSKMDRGSFVGHTWGLGSRFRM